MTLVYVLLTIVAVLLLYLVHKVRLGVARILQVHEDLRHLRRYGFTELAREVQSYVALTDLLDLDAPLPLLGGWAASADFLMEVVRQTRRRKPITAVELGSGASTIVIARTLQQMGEGHLYSLDHDARYANQTRRLLADHGLSAHATVIHAPLVPLAGQPSAGSWYSLDQLPVSEIDMLVVDGPPEAPGEQDRHPAGPALFPLLGQSGIVLVDDTRRDSGRKTIGRWAEEFPDLEVDEVPCQKGCTILAMPGGERREG